MDLSKKHIDKSKLRASTFWDVDFEKFDPNEHIAFVINRLAHRASMSEFYYLLNTFSYNEILTVLENYKGVDKFVLNFYKQMQNV